MGKRLRIYIAGPYTAEDQEAINRNVEAAIDAAIDIFHLGHFPYVPHLTGFIDLRAQEREIHIPWEEYIRWDMEWLSLCDALLYLSPSPGADLELKAAEEMNKMVFRSLEEIPEGDSQ